AIHPTPADLLTQQLSTACRNREIAAVKIGMVATQTNIRAIIWFLQHTPVPHIVIDPILHSSSGAPLLESKAVALYRQQLLPLATVITPNLSEASTLAGQQVSRLDTMRSAAEAIHHEVSHFRTAKERPLAVIVKGGHLTGDATDILYDGATFSIFSAQRIPGKSPRGTGCRFSSAIAAYLAQGHDLRESVKRAKEYLGKYITDRRGQSSGE
ncbi:MAG: hydroxymethylpyrimidine/phosphomethylpyrimidine kinase, partial [Deltaproteobacteria bacterium]|nr:hydroxymethylpyrimidine/phosphomethylpyrimidine kinase [Deltaproteobacteria bacterium]